MKLILGTHKEIVAPPGKSPEEREITYFMDIQDNQVTLIRACPGEDFLYEDVLGDHQGYRALDQLYYGQIVHAINAYILMRMGHTECEGAWAALDEMKRILAELPGGLQ